MEPITAKREGAERGVNPPHHQISKLIKCKQDIMSRWLSKKDREERDRRIVKLRMQGLAYKQIAERLSIHTTQVGVALRKAGMIRRK